MSDSPQRHPADNWVSEWCSEPQGSRQHRDELTLALEGLLFDVAEDNEPYQLLSDAALRLGPRAQSRIAELAKELLLRWQNNTWVTVLTERAQFNLLHLCANLEVGNALVEPIWWLYDHRAEFVARAYMGTPIQSALLEAMIQNQPKDRSTSSPTREFWLKLLKGQPPTDFPATLGDGFFGFVRMPHLSEDPAPIAEAELVEAATYVWRNTDKQNRPDQFDRLLTFIPKTILGLDLERIKSLAMYHAVIKRFEQDVNAVVPEQFHPAISEIAREIAQKAYSAPKSFNKQALLNLIRLEARKHPFKLNQIIRAHTTDENAIPESLLGREHKMLAGVT
jgi:hypothetical protein